MPFIPEVLKGWNCTIYLVWKKHGRDEILSLKNYNSLFAYWSKCVLLLPIEGVYIPLIRLRISVFDKNFVLQINTEQFILPETPPGTICGAYASK